jgi:hypothetical protein
MVGGIPDAIASRYVLARSTVHVIPGIVVPVVPARRIPVVPRVDIVIGNIRLKRVANEAVVVQYVTVGADEVNAVRVV